MVDATAGNGYDTLALVRMLADAGGGTLLAVDLQAVALERSRGRLRDELHGWQIDEADDAWRCSPSAAAVAAGGGIVSVRWVHGDHQAVLAEQARSSVHLVVFNLGYLPGADREVVTRGTATVRALEHAEQALVAGGCLSVTVYPGHPEGIEEELAVLDHASSLPHDPWSVHHTVWLNQRNKRTGRRAPSLVLIQRCN